MLSFASGELRGNETELMAIMSLQASASLPHLSAELATAVSVSVSTRIHAVPSLFAQQSGVTPSGNSLQLPNFGALRPWSEILDMLQVADQQSSDRLLVIMIRHGEAWENLNPSPNSECEFEYEGNIIQNFDSDLSDAGVSQAQQLNSLLREMAPGKDQNLTWFEALGLSNKSFLSSPLTRTLQTSKRALASLPVPRVVATEVLRASIGTDVCNYRRSILTKTDLHNPPAPFSSGCTLPDDSLAEIYSTNSDSNLTFEFPIRPPGGTGWGMYSDEESLWRSDVEDQSHQSRALAFLTQLFEHQADLSADSRSKNAGVVGVVTHGEMIRAVYEAVGEVAYDALNTQVVPLMLERSR